MVIQASKKIVRASNLTIRFYRRDGWTKKCLEAYASEIYDSHLLFNDAEAESYFVIDNISKAQCALLYQFEVSNIVRAFGGHPNEDDETYFCRVLGGWVAL